jgi:ribosome maturation factor RimP
MAPGVRREEIAESIAAALAEAGYELVDLKLVPRPGNLSVQIFIDHRAGLAAITHGDCTRASRAVQDRVDLDRYFPGRYLLEVSSPGIDRPLKRPEHYARFRGQPVVAKLGTERGGEVRGTIGESDAESVTIEREDGGSERLRFADIASAHLKRDPWKGRAKQTDDDER